MKTISESRRSLIKGMFGSVFVLSLLSACSTQESKSRQATQRLTSLLRHHSVAAHLGRLQIEANPALASMTKAQLASEIFDSINLDISTIDDTPVNLINEHLSARIRQDFADEAVTTVDGWLLSITEAQVCALVYLQVTKPDV